MLIRIQHFHLIQLVIYRRNIFHTVVDVIGWLKFEFLEFIFCGEICFSRWMVSFPWGTIHEWCLHNVSVHLHQQGWRCSVGTSCKWHRSRSGRKLITHTQSFEFILWDVVIANRLAAVRVCSDFCFNVTQTFGNFLAKSFYFLKFGRKGNREMLWQEKMKCCRKYG